MQDYRDFYIRWKGHPAYKEGEIIIEDATKAIVQKIELCLFTNKGDFIGDINFGCDLEFYLWETNVSADFIKSSIQDQFDTYIPELRRTNYTLDVFITEGTLQDILVVNITVNDAEVKAIFR